jgi:hypothetical protein
MNQKWRSYKATISQLGVRLYEKQPQAVTFG